MRLLQSSFLWIATLLLPTCASGQCYTALLEATYDGTTMEIAFRVGFLGWGPAICRGNAVAFDLYRSTLGYECGAEERVTEQPIPIAWPADELGVFETSCADPGVTLNTAYRYEARLVDPERNPAQDTGSVRGYGVAGVALLAHGQLGQQDFPLVDVLGCPGECFVPAGIVTGSGLNGSLPFGSTVDLYGSNIYMWKPGDYWQTALWVTSISPSECLVAVEPVSWAALKRLYK